MKTPQILVAALLLSSLPSVAQMEIAKTIYPSISPEEVTRLPVIKPIKLHFRDVTLKDALKEVERQTGVPIETRFAPEGVLNQKLSLDIETNSFRKATTAIFEEAGVDLVLQNIGGGNRWSIAAENNVQQNKEAPSSGQEPFQVRLQNLSVNSSKSIQFGESPANASSVSSGQNMNASLQLDIDPRISLVGSRIELTRAEDNQGRSLIPDNKALYFNQSLNLYQNIRLQVPAPEAHQLAHLDGNIIYVLGSKPETWEVPDIMNTQNAEHDFQAGNTKVHLSITRAQKVDNRVQLGIVVDLISPTRGVPGLLPHPLMQPSQLAGSVRLVDAQGKTLETIGFSGGGGNERLRGEISYFLPNAGTGQTQEKVLEQPLKAIVTAPAEFVQTEVPFSFSNVPLP